MARPSNEWIQILVTDQRFGTAFAYNSTWKIWDKKAIASLKMQIQDTDTGSTDATDLEWLRDSADSKVYWIQIFKIYLYTK